MKIDYKLIKYKILYFCVYLQYYVLHLYKADFIKVMFKISNDDLVFYVGALSLITFVCSLGISYYADKNNNHKFHIITLQVMSCIFFNLIFFNPNQNKILMWITISCFSITNSSIVPIFDRAAYSMLNIEHSNGQNIFGVQRMFGTFAFLLGGYCIGAIINIKKTNVYNYANLRFYNIFTTVLAVVVIFKELKNTEVKKIKEDTYKKIQILFSEDNYDSFLIILTLDSVLKGGFTLILLKYWNKILEEDASHALSHTFPYNFIHDNYVSTLSFLGTFLELLILYYSKKLIIRYTLIIVFVTAELISVVRLILYLSYGIEIKNNLCLTLAIELFRGLYLGLFNSVCTQICMYLSYEGIKSSIIVLYQCVNIGVGILFGGIIFS